MQRSLNMLPIIAIASLAVISNPQARDFRSADVQPADYPTVLATQQIGKIVSEKTGGHYSIKVYANSTLGSEADTTEQVKIGALDMVRVSTAAFHSIVPATAVLGLPFLFRDVEHYRKVIYGPIGDEVLAKFEPAGFVGLVMYEAGARSIYTRKPVRTPADVKGMKIRVMPSDLWVALISAIGAAPTPMPWSEVYTALKTGVVDAAEGNYPATETSKHWEAVSYYSETRHVMNPEVVVFSKKVWDALSDQERKTLREAAKESIPYYVKLWTDKEKVSRDLMEKNGMKFVTDVDREAFAKLEKPVWDRFAGTPDLKKILDEIVSTK